jgi:hypothetical protein
MSRDNEKDFEMNQDFNEREFAGLAQALRENRPSPEPDFTERLDQAVADHFPPEWADETALGKQGKGGIGTPGERFRRWLAGNRTLIPAFAGTVGLLFIVAVVVVNTNSGSNFGGAGSDSASTDTAKTETENVTGEGAGDTAGGASADTAISPSASKATEDSADSATYGSLGEALRELKPGSKPLTERSFQDLGIDTVSGRPARNRDVAREAEITLGTDPDGVQDAANKVVEVTDDHNGIVMDSKVTDGEEGAAGASFSLLIPSGQIESAVADLSGIADLKSRSQELTDITAPTTKTEDKVADSKAKIKSLLGELEETYDEDERAQIEQKIRWERNDLSYYETRLNRLERRADYTPVALKVETGGDSASDGGSSSWGLTDAIDDAGNRLGVAAGVTVLALAVAIPIGIVVLIALALNRAWVRRSRRRVLADDE